MTPQTHNVEPIGEQPVPQSSGLVAMGLGLMVEFALVWGVWSGVSPLHWALCGHVLLIGLLSGYTVWRSRNGHDVRIEAWLCWFTLTLGPLGPIATFALLLMTNAFGRVAKPFEEWYASLFPEEDTNASERLYQRLMSGREDAIAEGSVGSLTDVLFTGNTRAKQAVVALLARRFRSDFAPALQMALNDPEASIRVQAATAASAIEERFHAQRLELEETARQHKGDRVSMLDLARHMDEYAYAGVLDADRQLATMTAALDSYRAARGYDAAPDAPETDGDQAIDIAIGRLLLRLDRIEEAADHLAALSQTSPDPRPTLWHVECLYRLRRFDALRKRINDPRLAELALTDTYGNVNPVLNLWQISALSDLMGDLPDMSASDPVEAI
jgi:hypothetical protein